jgi:hypothetical protein
MLLESPQRDEEEMFISRIRIVKKGSPQEGEG